MSTAQSSDIENPEADALPGVLAPFQNTHLIGHTELFSQLKSLIAQDRLPSGIMLAGPRGIGKATLAFALAREILLQTGDQPAERINEQVFNGVHPNLFALRRQPRDAKSFYANIRVDEIRETVARMQKTRGQAGHRICILDAAEDCNIAAANALLKTLEEPPSETHFILITHRPGRLLPTIRSRCQVHNMRALSAPDVKTILTEQSCEAEEDILRLSAGNARDAFELLQLGDLEVLNDLQNWLKMSARRQADHLQIASKLGNANDDAVAKFAYKLMLNWLSDHARNASSVSSNFALLARVDEVWKKANQLLEDTESFNLDKTQTFTTIMELIAPLKS